MKKGKRNYLPLGWVAIVLLATACTTADEDTGTITGVYTFTQDAEGWQAGFADLPGNPPEFDSSLYELEAGWSSLPNPLNTTQGAFMIQGHNRSDDLFMFLAKKINGLQPGSTYEVDFDLSLASNAASGAAGIGGAPGESVYLKVGAIGYAPEVVVDVANNFREVNFDKGNQSQGGSDMVVIGDVANGKEEFVYNLIRRQTGNRPVKVKANAAGEIWLLVGTDSGFEGLTRLYYDEIKVTIRQ